MATTKGVALALRAIARRHQVDVSTDSTFQCRARILQAIWREEQGLPIGTNQGKPLGSRLAMPAAKEHLWNFQSEAARAAVRREVLGPDRDPEKLYGEPRILENLLSSQPLCFNLFAELERDLALASCVFESMTAGRVDRVTRIEFEHSPGRGNEKYTGDRSAFDVYVEYVTAAGAKGFAGIEVKYHENLANEPAPHPERYDSIADKIGVFRPEARPRLHTKPLQQIWRDHLLAGSLLRDAAAGFSDGFFVFLYPADNEACASAVEAYRSCLLNEMSFVAWTLESFIAAVRSAGAREWVDAVADRYLGFGKIDALVSAIER